MVHDRKIDGRDAVLGVSGDLIDGNLIMYDKETDERILQMTGAAIAGDKKGERRLVELPAAEVTKSVRWDEWKKLHPQSLVLICPHCGIE